MLHDHAIALTVDVEWAHSDVLADIVRLFDEHEVKATFFCTHVVIPGQERGFIRTTAATATRCASFSPCAATRASSTTTTSFSRARPTFGMFPDEFNRSEIERLVYHGSPPPQLAQARSSP